MEKTKKKNFSVPRCLRGEFHVGEARLLKVGLTGGMAAGKTTVGAMLAALGARVVQADAIAHQLMLPGEPVYEEVVRRFGRGILDPDGKVNRSRLAEAAFQAPPGGGPRRIQELNEIVHPAVLRRQNEWMEEIGRSDPHAIAVVEAALLLEAGAGKDFDRLIVVTCRPEQRVERWSQRAGVDTQTARAEVTRRMASQWPDEEKIKAADYVIDNSGSLQDTNDQVRELYAQLEEQAGGSG